MKAWAKIKKGVMEAGVYFALFALTLLLFWIVKPLLMTYKKGAFAQSIMLFGVIAVAAVVAYMGMTKKLNHRRILILLLLVGYVVRLGYILYTPPTYRQHDTFSKNFDGHEAYAWTIFSTGSLPTTNDYQFYHPPLNALLQAGFMKIMEGLTGFFFDLSTFPSLFNYAKPDYIDSDLRYYLYGSCQILSLLYSTITAVVLVKIVHLFDFSGKVKLLLSAFVVLYPRQIQFSGQLNNDGIAYLMATLALYYALRWQKGDKAPAWILACAFAVGLGMMAKLSSATVCLPIAGIFLYEFVRTLQKKGGAMKLGAMIWQYAAFLLFCAPVGLWFQVYANIRFGQEFGFVFSNLTDRLYTGDHSLFGRFVFTLDLSEYFGSIYCRPFEGHYNLFNFALRSSIFGETTYSQGEGLAAMAVLTAYSSAILLGISLVWAIVACVRTRKGEDSLYKRAELPFFDLLFTLLLVQSQALSEMYFYAKMPYGCTMDFRYIMPMILGMALTLGYTRKVLAVQGGRFSAVMNRLTLISVLTFLTLSTLFYCVCI